MRLFVSYTRRDGCISDEMLMGLYESLCTHCKPFIHSVLQDSLRFQQLGVILALLRADVFLLVQTPGCLNSPWVRAELAIAKVLRLPMYRVAAGELWSNKVFDPTSLFVLKGRNGC